MEALTLFVQNLHPLPLAGDVPQSHLHLDKAIGHLLGEWKLIPRFTTWLKSWKR